MLILSVTKTFGFKIFTLDGQLIGLKRRAGIKCSITAEINISIYLHSDEGD